MDCDGTFVCWHVYYLANGMKDGLVYLHMYMYINWITEWIGMFDYGQ